MPRAGLIVRRISAELRKSCPLRAVILFWLQQPKNAMTDRSHSGAFLVLVVSAETTIRQTRVLLLENEGYRVVAAESRHKAGEIMQQFDVDVAVLDHTLDKRDRKRLVRFVREFAPATRILLLHKSGADCGADLHIDSREGPETVISSVRILLGRVDINERKVASAMGDQENPES